MVRVKVCGITNLEDAKLAVELGADALGFIFADSPRQVSVDAAAEIISELPPFVNIVGVFVDESAEVVSHAVAECRLDTLQFHGDESPTYLNFFQSKVIKAFRVKDEKSLESLPKYKADAYLLDTYVEDVPGGTGKTFDWTLAKKAKEFGPIILSGGIDAVNVRVAIDEVRPFAIDVCSGVEKEPGKKDPAKLKRFMKEVKKV